ncbi:MAG: ribonuclease HI [Chloroflexi bacterium]|nr:ribonuclease HI [Chloroflexota bacterium]
MNCREKPAPGAKAKPGGGRGRSVTRAGNLTTTEILLRFSSGPTDGVFTDGSCQGNPGPGGWGAVHVRDGKVLEQRWGSDPATTNNRMELTAMIEGLAMTAPDEAIEVYSDSMLVVNTLTKWASSWAARGWKRKEGEVANLDLVQRAYELMQERPKARVQWLRAHDGSRWNEYADSLSQAYLREEV